MTGVHGSAVDARRRELGMEEAAESTYELDLAEQLDMSPGCGGERTDAAMADLAPETLARVFAFLDPPSLVRCACVCRLWRTIVSSDATWRAALAVGFGLEAREEAIRRHGDTALRVAPALRRLAPSWRGEYTQRVALLRAWRRSRTPTILTDPRIAALDALALSSNHRFVLSLSHGFSVAARSNVFTGKVAKDYLDAGGFASRGANGQPDVSASPPTTALATDASAARIVWGLRSGDLSLTTIDWRGQSARGTVRNHALPTGGAHRAAVTAIAFVCPANRGGMHSDERMRQQLAAAGAAGPTFATAAADGSVCVWHPKRRTPIWTASAVTGSDLEASVRPAVTALAYAPAVGALVAARADGALAVWTGVPWADLAVPNAAADQAPAAPPHSERYALLAYAPVETLLLDTARGHRVTFLTHAAGARDFVRHDVALDSAPAAHRTTVFGAPHTSPLTALRADFDVRARASLPDPMLARMRATRLQERKFVAAGTASGAVGLWEWDAPGVDAAPPAAAHGPVPPAMVLAAHHNAITALALTPVLVFVGTEDGTVKALDALGGGLVRTFNERTARRHPARMLATGELSATDAARFRVTQILAADDMFVAAIGAQVLAWRTHAAAEADSGAGRSGGAAAARVRGSGAERVRQRADMDSAVAEGAAQVRAERDAAAAEGQRRTALIASMHGGLDEDDALDYALQLSRESLDELSPELLYDDLGLEARDGDSDATPLSPPLVASDSRAWDILQTAGRHAAATGETPGSWSKLRTVAVPRSARLATSPASGSGSMSSSSWRGASESLSALDAWPEVSTSPAARSPASLGAWAKHSPVLRAADAPPGEQRRGRSALVPPREAGPPPPPGPWEPEREDDADMRLALELSLAEYESVHGTRPSDV